MAFSPTSAGLSLLQATDIPFVNQYGQSRPADRRQTRNAPGGAGSGTPGGGGSPVISLSRTSASFTAVSGYGNPSAQGITIDNSGSGTLTYTLTGTPLWLSITPTSGSAPVLLTIQPLIAGLSVGTHTTTITVNGSGATPPTATFSVSITIYSGGGGGGGGEVVPAFSSTKWLGYFKTYGNFGNYISAAIPNAANCAHITIGDFGSDPEGAHWRTELPIAAAALTTYGAKLITACDTDHINIMSTHWDRVAALWVNVTDHTESTAESVSQTIRDARALMVSLGLANRPIIGYTDNTTLPHMPYWIDGLDAMSVYGYLDYLPGETTTAVAIRLRAQLSAAINSLKTYIPSWGRIFLVGQSFARSGAWLDLSTVTAMQPVYYEFMQNDPVVQGLLSFAYYRDPAHDQGVATNPDWRAWHEAAWRSNPGTATIDSPPYTPYGSLDVCTTSTISGWAYDPDVLNTPVTVQIFDGPRSHINPTAGRVAQIAADLARPDIISITNDLGNHGFSISTPAVLLDGYTHAVHVYGVDLLQPIQIQLVDSPGEVTGSGAPPPGEPIPGISSTNQQFTYVDVPFPWRSVYSGAAIPDIIAHGLGNCIAACIYWSSKGVTALRIPAMSAVPGHECTPSIAGYYSAWADLFATAATYNLKIEVVLLNDLSSITELSTPISRNAFITTFESTFANVPLYTVDLNNQVEVDEGLALAAQIHTLNPYRMISLGSPTTDNSADLLIPPATYGDFSSSYSSDWNWITRFFDLDLAQLNQSTTCVIDANPHFSADPIDPDHNNMESRWFAYGFASGIRNFSTTFNYPTAAASTLPNTPQTQLLDAWLLGLGLVPLAFGGTYFNSFGGSPFYNTGHTLIVGRATSTESYTLVIAPSSWEPSLRRGWATDLLASYNPTDGDSIWAFYATKA